MILNVIEKYLLEVTKIFLLTIISMDGYEWKFLKGWFLHCECNKFEVTLVHMFGHAP